MYILIEMNDINDHLTEYTDKFDNLIHDGPKASNTIRKTNIYNSNIKMPSHKIWLRTPRLKISNIFVNSSSRQSGLLSVILTDYDEPCIQFRSCIERLEAYVTALVDPTFKIKSCISLNINFTRFLSIQMPILKTLDMSSDVINMNFNIYDHLNRKIKYSSIPDNSLLDAYIELSDIWENFKTLEFGINLRVLQMKVYPEFDFTKCVFGPENVNHDMLNNKDISAVDIHELSQTIPMPPLALTVKQPPRITKPFVPSINDLLNIRGRLKPISVHYPRSGSNKQSNLDLDDDDNDDDDNDSYISSVSTKSTDPGPEHKRVDWVDIDDGTDTENTILSDNPDPKPKKKRIVKKIIVVKRKALEPLNIVDDHGIDKPESNNPVVDPLPKQLIKKTIKKPATDPSNKPVSDPSSKKPAPASNDKPVSDPSSKKPAPASNDKPVSDPSSKKPAPASNNKPVSDPSSKKPAPASNNKRVSDPSSKKPAPASNNKPVSDPSSKKPAPASNNKPVSDPSSKKPILIQSNMIQQPAKSIIKKPLLATGITKSEPIVPTPKITVQAPNAPIDKPKSKPLLATGLNQTINKSIIIKKGNAIVCD